MFIWWKNKHMIHNFKAVSYLEGGEKKKFARILGDSLSPEFVN